MEITSYFGLSQPGGLAVIAGKGFGQQRGLVIVKLQTLLFTTRSVAFIIKEWSPTRIGVERPVGIVGVRDQRDAIVEVRHADHNPRATRKVFFRAATDYKLLPMSDISVAACGKDGNKNRCNHVNPGRNGTCAIDPFMNSCSGTFGGFHYNCHGAVGSDSGTDEFSITLFNGWTITDVSVQKDAGVGSPVPALTAGNTTWKPKVTWSVGPGGMVEYCAHVYITGPKGVPH
jgi:hypothetical protein